MITAVLLFTLFCHTSAHIGHHHHPPPSGSDHALHDRRPSAGDCSICHGIVCNEFNFTAWWHRSEFVGDEYDVKLLDSTCNNFHQNQTTVWITSKFGTCGSAIIENKKFITQKNTATLTVRNVTSNIAREHVYKYNLDCLFWRRNNASTGYKLIQGIKKTVDLNDETEFDISINIYTSPSYLIKSGLPVTISMNQPIYVGIRKVHNNKHFKMIVEQCFATPFASVGAKSYVFFLNKCGTDSTFRIVPTEDKDLFSFVITAFRFVEISKSIYMHCRAIMCQTKSNSAQCTQSCGQHSSSQIENRRHRRRAHPHHDTLPDVFANSDVEEIQNITSQKIVFVEKRTCSSMSCDTYATCIDLYPAVCRCNPGYVYSAIEKACVNERILKINSLHLKSPWVRTYGEDESEDFKRFATDSESNLMKAFTRLSISHIDGVKVTKAQQKRGVLIDMSIVYRPTSTLEDVVETFIKPFGNQDPAFLSTLEKMNINTDTVPHIFQGTYAPGPTPKLKPTAEKVEVVTNEVEAPPVTQKKKTLTFTNSDVIGTDGVSVSVARNSTTTVGYFQQRTLIWILLAISFAAIVLVVGLVCHYKRHIYYHLMTW